MMSFSLLMNLKFRKVVLATVIEPAEFTVTPKFQPGTTKSQLNEWMWMKNVK
jgi:hypothetical protein